MKYWGLLCLPLLVFSELKAAPETETDLMLAPGRAVTRDFGQIKNEQVESPLFAQQFRSGQMAYYFSDYSRALKHWQPLAERGHADAQANIGWMYQMGLGLRRDLSLAYQWYQRAAKQDQAVAQNNLGVMYEKGFHVKPDKKQAFNWYRLSAENGYRFGQYNLAQQLDYKGDIEQANHWYIQAARQGVEAAQKILRERGIKY